MEKLQDQMCFKYYLKHCEELRKDSRNYGCNHNGFRYGIDMQAKCIQIVHIRNGKEEVIADSGWVNKKIEFKDKCLKQYLENISTRVECFLNIKNYKTKRQFKIYTDVDYRREKVKIDLKKKKKSTDSFRDLVFLANQEIYHMSVNVNICKQMEYCCKVIPEEELDNWYFRIFLNPTYEDRNSEEFQERCRKAEKMTYDQLIRRYLDEKAKKLKGSTKEKSKKGDTNSAYKRSEYVAEIAKRRANGVCELADAEGNYHDAPFSVEGKPYLEAHHVMWLSEGGRDDIDNVVALCPNCHRKMHYLKSDKDVDALINRLSTYKDNL